MMLKNPIKSSFCAMLFVIPTFAFADEAAEQMVQDVLPMMHYTCASIAEEADGDEAFVVEVVGKMTALSLYNRQINIEDHAASDEEKAQLREAFIAALSEGCAADKNALLGGVVDNAVKSTLGL
ncbi:YmgD family protein [Ruegeria sp. SCSIO 43209]|uniref:YmgD family protein n=1 Tax=Ruegeria sp. SCSIO 43209 TaxID=2793010 RepID=UPI001CA95880|nr:YmgD family protein [Ruegeria sp. SCSIO 43209]UAB87836.1 YmgD family protein [Ruegeria sp. SCSIO 43209]